VPRMFDTINNRIAYEPVGGLPLLSFSAVDPKGVQFALKHAFDRALAALLLLALAPVLGLVALAVRLSSPGPVLYRQRRVGRDGQVFDLYKFRSMRVDGDPKVAEHSVIDSLLGGDTAPGGVEGSDRRTPIGRFLRRTSLDELPQLFNVLRGEMSTVGPRPERPEFVDLFTAPSASGWVAAHREKEYRSPEPLVPDRGTRDGNQTLSQPTKAAERSAHRA
jgi:lipopolysaccharide/colanic/teichoic acid biosynthesis glycosyltransferase